MAIALEFSNLIINRYCFCECFPGGWELFCAFYPHDEDGQSFDQHLIRCGAMNDFSMHMIIKDQEEIGLQLMGKVKGRNSFVDMCLLGAGAAKLPYPCAWLEYVDNDEYGSVQFKGDVPKAWTREKIGDDFLYYGEMWERQETGWSNELRAFSRRHLTETVTSTSLWLGKVPMKHHQGKFGMLTVSADPDQPLNNLEPIQITNRWTGEQICFRNIGHVLRAGWAVD